MPDVPVVVTEFPRKRELVAVSVMTPTSLHVRLVTVAIPLLKLLLGIEVAPPNEGLYPPVGACKVFVRLTDSEPLFDPEPKLGVAAPLAVSAVTVALKVFPAATNLLLPPVNPGSEGALAAVQTPFESVVAQGITKKYEGLTTKGPALGLVEPARVTEFTVVLANSVILPTSL